MVDKATLAQARQELEDLYIGISPTTPSTSPSRILGAPSMNHRRGRWPTCSQSMNNQGEGVNQESKDGSTRNQALISAEPFRKQESPLAARPRLSQGSYTRNTSEGSIAIMIDGSRDSQCYSEGGSRLASPMGDKGKKRRPGIPHSNLCALCKEYIHIFRTRCLYCDWNFIGACGRVYCKVCVDEGMGEMSEGRKCVDCLGQGFSQRYIERAAKAGCCWRYPSAVKLQELKWAEKGPRRSGESRYRSNRVVSRSQNPLMFARSRSPVMGRGGTYASDDPLSFVARSTFSHY